MAGINLPRQMFTRFASISQPNKSMKPFSSKLLSCARFFSTKPDVFDKVLIANRGEIARRVIYSCKKLGIKTVSVYSDIDKNSQHVLEADEAFPLAGPGINAANLTYLNQERIVDICKASGAQAVHPGYGFLSENSTFATALENSGVSFVGPPAEAMLSMGSKSESKAIMEANGVPCTPGYHGEDQSFDKIKEEASKIGYPVMLKAVMGGGGKGMRQVFSESELAESFDSCKRESLSSFGDDRILIEKLLVGPRHIEFQVFADKHGNCVHLFERDCSVQRRHQKVLEEAPAPGISPELRAEMGKAAVNAAKAVKYVGAGTVEFMLDPKTLDFYFMEMNTRLQVEHPVTELVTGVDLVKLQLQIAAGQPLPFEQKDLSLTGHAIEARIYAENPKNNFFPDSGKLKLHRLPVGSSSFSPPDKSSNIRVDYGFVSGDDISVFYDPMISKMIAYGETRTEAIGNLTRGLGEYKVSGLENNISFVSRCLNTPEFKLGSVTTDFIPQHESQVIPEPQNISHDLLKAVGVKFLADALHKVVPGRKYAFRTSGTSTETKFVSISSSDHNPEEFCVIGEVLDAQAGSQLKFGVRVYKYSKDHLQMIKEMNGIPLLEFELSGSLLSNDTVSIELDGRKFAVDVFSDKSELYLLNWYGQLGSVKVEQFQETYHGAAGAGSDQVVSPMPGRVVKLLVKEGDEVEVGDSVIVMEAMKMEHVIKAEKQGVVNNLNIAHGDFVDAQQILCKIE